MTTRTTIKPNSYKTDAGYWVPHGTIRLSDTLAVAEYTKTYLNVKKPTKKEADNYFLKLNK